MLAGEDYSGMDCELYLPVHLCLCCFSNGESQDMSLDKRRKAPVFVICMQHQSFFYGAHFYSMKLSCFLEVVKKTVTFIRGRR
jgi:hypothetical protein